MLYISCDLTVYRNVTAMRASRTRRQVDYSGARI